MNAITSTFEVSSVSPATKALSEMPYDEAIESLLGIVRRPPDWSLRGPVETSDATPTGSVEACSGSHGRLLAPGGAHPVIEALSRAFMDHRPLCLSPDMIWLLLCQGVAHHVNVHAETLRSRFVQHQGTLKIEVRRDDLVKGSAENPWDEVIHELSMGVRDHIGPAHALFVPRFSTTGVNERVAAEIVLLDAMQSYFEYSVRTICGIPAVSLEGTVEDWQELADRARAFVEFDLEWWLTPLQPILDEFVAAARGAAHPSVWQSIFKLESYSGGASVTGWIMAFFPYLKDRHGNPSVKNQWLADGGVKLQRMLTGESTLGSRVRGPSLGVFPSGLARAPFVWTYLTRKFEMEFLGGFVGVGQDAATLTLRPEIGWAIRETALTSPASLPIEPT